MTNILQTLLELAYATADREFLLGRSTPVDWVALPDLVKTSTAAALSQHSIADVSEMRHLVERGEPTFPETVLGTMHRIAYRAVVSALRERGLRYELSTDGSDGLGTLP